MPITPRQGFLTPFADESMRLLREKWANPTMLAEELFAILQQKIPLPPSGPLTINLSLAGQDFIKFQDQFGNPVAAVDFNGNLVKRKTQQPRASLQINWDDPAPIAPGDALSSTQLNAVAVDRISGYTIAGTYEYDPPSGTVMSAGAHQPLRVVFTPTNSAAYKRTRKTVFIDVGATLKIPVINWTVPADIWLGTALSGTQLNATATDPDTMAPVPGTFLYTPASGTVLGRGVTFLNTDFTPTDGATYDVNSFGVDIGVRGIFLIAVSSGSITVDAGDAIITVVTTTDSSPGATVTVTDSASNSYTQAGTYVRVDDGSTYKATSIWYAFAAAPGTITITRTPSSGSVEQFGQGRFLGVLAFDGMASVSGTGGESLTGATCPVNVDNELVVMYAYPVGMSLTAVSGWNIAAGAAGLYVNVTIDPNNANTPPEGGANVAVDAVASGTAPGSTLWTIIQASFTHRTS